MQKLETMFWSVDGKIARLELNRPHVLNAMDNQATIDLGSAADAIAREKNARVVIITGAGRSFSTGMDLKKLAANKVEMIYHHRFERALRVFETMDKIVIAAIKEYCLGGGLQLALACDVRVAADNAILGLPAIKESLVPGLGTWRLPHYIGLGRAKKLILSGDNIKAKDALRIGLVDHVVPLKQFEKRLEKIARAYLANCSEGTRQSKQLLNRSFDLEYDPFLKKYFELQEIAQTSSDHAEAKRAYREKR
ncbi:MAG: enoyl-CoA hydratase/isomerase family protein, partial [Chloroflexi bacterium]|nr:enoyl-CoA hydratase/isomerase family protein [Chloroflexota bacterium]